jgi:hypothetical protein
VPPHAEPGADQPELPPVYSGPTPANPFGAHAFDIFDVLEQAEQAPPLAAAPPAVTEPQPAPVPSLLLDEPEPAQAQSTGAEAEPGQPPATPQQADEPEPAVRPEPEPVAADDAAQEPLVKPIVIGSAQDVVVEKKRGWWRR